MTFRERMSVNPSAAEEKVAFAIDPRDLSIEEISTETGMHRNTISKYVWGLEKEGKIGISRKIGRAKMYVANKEASKK